MREYQILTTLIAILVVGSVVMAGVFPGRWEVASKLLIPTGAMLGGATNLSVHPGRDPARNGERGDDRPGVLAATGHQVFLF